jgi:hypothetical protein
VVAKWVAKVAEGLAKVVANLAEGLLAKVVANLVEGLAVKVAAKVAEGLVAKVVANQSTQTEVRRRNVLKNGF